MPVVIPACYRLAVTVLGRDVEFPGGGSGQGLQTGHEKGLGVFSHDDPADRPPAIFGGTATLHCGPSQQSCPPSPE
jgi:uncharacterized protein